MTHVIVVAGGTGDLGGRILKALRQNNAEVRAIVRRGTSTEKVKKITSLGIAVVKADLFSVTELTEACRGATCVISVLAGLREVVIDAQTVLLEAALAAGVPRFIPSDYSLDFTKFSPGENRNLDLRREFHDYLNQQPIAATSVFNGAFADMLTKEMPLILFKQKLILYWGNADHTLWFTTKNDTAAYTARVALDPAAPRYLRVAGDQKSPRELKDLTARLTGQKFRLLRAGNPGMLSLLIKVARKLAPGTKELYPAWQGMQYMRNMIDERASLPEVENNRYPDLSWTPVESVIKAHLAQTS